MIWPIAGGIAQLKAGGLPPVTLDNYGYNYFDSGTQPDPYPNAASMGLSVGVTGLFAAIVGLSITGGDAGPNITAVWGNTSQSMTRIGSYYEPTTQFNIIYFGLVNPNAPAGYPNQGLQVGGTSTRFQSNANGYWTLVQLMSVFGSNKTSVANAFKNFTTAAKNNVTNFTISLASASNNFVAASAFGNDRTSAGAPTYGGTQNPMGASYSFPGLVGMHTYQPGAATTNAVFTFPVAQSGAMCACNISP